VDHAPRLRACLRRWHLRGAPRLDGGFRSEPFGCTMAGDEVVVKLTAAPQEARPVLQACQAWRDGQPDLEACLSSDEFERLIGR
jgi:hypothetical protein